MKLRQVALGVGAGMCIGAGFIVPLLWPLGFFGTAILLGMLQKSDSLLVSALWAYLVSVIWHGIYLAPVFLSLFPFDWFGISSLPLQIGLVGFSWLGTTLAFSLGVAMFGALWHLARTDSWHDVYILPLAFVVSEWAGIFLFSVLLAGPGSLLGAHMSAGALGYLAANDVVLRQVAALFGQAGLSAVMVLGGYGVLWIWHNRQTSSHTVGWVLLGLLVAWAAGYGALSWARAADTETGSRVSVAVVSRYLEPQLSFAPGEGERVVQELFDTLLPLRGVSVLIFPENTTFIRSMDEGLISEADEALRTMGIGGALPLIIDSQDIHLPSGGLLSQVTYMQGESREYGFKQMVMPVGEYVPYVYRWLLSVLGMREFLNDVTLVRSYRAGPSGGMGVLENGAHIATRFCDEIYSGGLFRAEARAGATILANISSQSWFHGSPIVYQMMQTAARVRAVENGRYLVQSGNMTPAFILDPWGEVVAESSWGSVGVAQADVPSRTEKTPFTRMGDVLVYMGMAVLLSSVSVRAWRTRMHRVD